VNRDAAEMKKPTGVNSGGLAVFWQLELAIVIDDKLIVMLLYDYSLLTTDYYRSSFSAVRASADRQYLLSVVL
jgi:hypothetical protein